MTSESNALRGELCALQSEMLSLRVDNNRLNQLVNRGHIAVPENNNETAVEANESQSQLPRVAADQKPALEDLSLPAKSLGVNKLMQ